MLEQRLDEITKEFVELKQMTEDVPEDTEEASLLLAHIEAETEKLLQESKTIEEELKAELTDGLNQF